MSEGLLVIESVLKTRPHGSLEGEEHRGNQNMATKRFNDLRAFRDFLNAKLSNAGNSLTLDECLDLWDIENQTDEERDDTIRAVREALDDMRAGDTGVPAREVIADLRRKHNLPELT
jgi:hypothetical protein